MISFKKFKEICQKKDDRFWVSRNIYRSISIWISWLLTTTSISANIITIIGILSSLVGAFFLISPKATSQVISIIFLQIGCLLDHVDGEVARYRGKEGYGGEYLDCLGHCLIDPAIFICLGLNIYFSFNYIVFVYFGILMGVVRLEPALFARSVIWERLLRSDVTQRKNYIQVLIDENDRLNWLNLNSVQGRKNLIGYLAKAVYLIKKSHNYFLTYLVTLPLAIILDLLFPPPIFGYLISFKLLLFCYYVAVLMVRALLLVYKNFLFFKKLR